jgi:hypothetical protein
MDIYCAITQSWLIEHATTKMENLEATLKEDFANLLKTADISVVALKTRCLSGLRLVWKWVFHVYGNDNHNETWK